MNEKRGMDWRLLAILYALIAAAFIARTLYNSGTTPLFADTDDAMRLVVVRDFLNGQGWFDNIQHRMNTPFGAELHWSRLADLPLAGAIVLLRPLLGDAAEIVAAYAVPLLLLFVLLYLSGRIALRLVGSEGLLPAFALPAFSLSVLTEFAPGRIDHHSLQILLLMAMLWCSIEAWSRPRFAIGAGLAAATAIAIGVEGVPGIAAAILAFGMMWVTNPARADALRGFGASFALGTLAHLALALPPERWLTPACDALSLTYAAAAVAVGVAFVVLAALPLRGASQWDRLGTGLVAGAAATAGLALAFPDCLGGPYAALDPWLTTHWLNRIQEAAPLWTSLTADPVYPLGVAVPSLAALVVVAIRVSRATPERRGEWWIYAVFLALAVATMLLQIRASRLATPLAVPAGAWLIVVARHHYLARQTAARVALLVLSWLVSAGLAIGLATTGISYLADGRDGQTSEQALSDRRACVMPAAFTALAALPPARVMGQIDLGSHILAFTPHSVVAAPYHRNVDGVRDAFDFFNGPIGAALPILERRDVGLVVVCPALPEMRGLPDAAPDSFVRLHAEGRLPRWLAEMHLPDTPLEVYAVVPQQAER